MEIFVADLTEILPRSARSSRQRYKRSVDTKDKNEHQGPSVAKCFNCENVVSSVLLIILRRIDPLLEVRIVFDAVRRVEVNHLHIAAQIFVMEQDSITCNESPQMSLFFQPSSWV